MTIKIQKLFILLLLINILPVNFVQAGEMKSEDDIKREISFLAKKMLDISGEDSYALESPASTKPYIGICTSIDQQGMAITCVTPGSQADKSGLKTGDIVSKMNAVNLLNDDASKSKHAYKEIINNMSIGEEIVFTVHRENQTLPITITVGSVSHPAYSCNISKKVE